MYFALPQRNGNFVTSLGYINVYFCIRNYLLSVGCRVLGNMFRPEREEITGL